MSTTDKAPLEIGFMPLTDSAPLVVAKELGFFAQCGIQVNLRRQNSWATLRDKLHAGVLDAAQMLAPMPLASRLGLGGTQRQFITPFVLSFNGNGITLSERLYQQVTSLNAMSCRTPAMPLPAESLRAVIRQRQKAGQSKLRFATVFPFSCHFYQLCDWLRSGQIVPGQDVDIQVIPPTSMVAALHEGSVDGYCVGGPWNAKAVRVGLGVTVVTSCDIWPDMPEKVLGMLQSWQTHNPDSCQALLQALDMACRWLALVPNRFEAARILCDEAYLHADLDVVAPALLGSCLVQESVAPRYIPAYNRFASSGETPDNCPNPGYAEWFLSHMQSSGQLQQNIAGQNIAAEVYRADLYQGVFADKLNA